MIRLYDDQKQCLKNILLKFSEGKQRVLLVAPCGFGKTIVFSEIVRRTDIKGNSVLVIVHRQELLRQVSQTLRKFDVKHGIISNGYKFETGLNVYISTVQSLSRRLPDIQPKLIIIDECHHCLSPTFLRVLECYAGARLIGVTATPYRLDGRGLDRVFDSIVIGSTASELIEQGRLSRPVYYAPPNELNLDGIKSTMGDYNIPEVENRLEKSHITGDAILHYQKLANGKKAVVFCTSCKHSERVANSFRVAGIPASNIDGKMTIAERISIIEKFRNGDISVLTSCELISEGFDLPAIEVAIMLRPTQSLCVWVQQVGRAMRVSDGKTNCIILDHVGNVFRHGAIESITDWSLDGVQKRLRNREPLESIRRCKHCFIIMTGNICQFCGNEPEISVRELKIREGELQRIEIENIKKQQRREQGMARSFDELYKLGIERGMKNPRGWAWNVIKSRKKHGF